MAIEALTNQVQRLVADQALSQQQVQQMYVSQAAVQHQMQALITQLQNPAQPSIATQVPPHNPAPLPFTNPVPPPAPPPPAPPAAPPQVLPGPSAPTGVSTGPPLVANPPGRSLASYFPDVRPTLLLAIAKHEFDLGQIFKLNLQTRD